ncbi:MAG: N-acetylmuramoyl-L-alanine amidase [Bacillota bacterium]
MIRRHLYIPLLILSLLLSGLVLGQDLKLVIDGKPLVASPPPEIRDGRAFIPLRAALESLGATVDWVSQGGKDYVVVTKHPFQARLVIGDTKVTYADGTVLDMKVAPYIKESRTMVPVRFLAEALGYQVNWDPQQYLVTVTSPPPPPAPTLPEPAELLTIYLKNNELRLAVDGYAAFDYDAAWVESPDRFVLDLKGVRPSEELLQQLVTPDPRIKGVRYAINSSDPLVTRIVVEFASRVAYQVRRDGPAFAITFGDPIKRPFDAAKPLAGWVIAVDPGHGGADTGARGYTGYLEKNVNLAVSQLVRAKLAALGAQVVMTRTTDQTVSLNDRVKLALQGGADLFLSIHSDSYPTSSAMGSTGLYQIDRAEQEALARPVHAAYLMATARLNRSVREQDLYVLRNTPLPATLLELGFISNPDEERLLKDPQFQDKAATGIVNGVVNYVTAQSNK